jgi:hypothetical protein
MRNKEKKLIFLLALALILAMLAGCTSSTDGGGGFTWTREGTFADDAENLLSIYSTEDEENPGWYVGCFLGEGMYGGVIPQEGKTLHGNISYDEGVEYVVTVSEEGDDGVLLATPDGEYHFAPYELPEAAFTVMVNTEGDGQIAYAPEGETIAFDDEYPSQSAYVGLEGPEVYTFAAKPDEGWKFMKWTNFGEEYSREEQFTVEVTEDMDLVAVFGVKGSDETPVDLDAAKTLGELLGLPNYGYACTEQYYAYAFEQDEHIYRAVAEISPETSQAVFDLDWDDDQYEEKLRAIIGDVPLLRIDDLTAGIPEQAELDALAGKTVGELLEDGWYCGGWNLMDNIIYMHHGFYDYIMTFDEEIEDPESFDEEDLLPLVISSVKFDQIGDPSSLDDLME